MKIRNGFVSNSSSSSFVIAKCYLNEQQIDAIKKAHSKWVDEGRYFGDSGQFLEEDENYISFEVYNIYTEFMKMCKENGIEKDKIFFTEM